MILQSLVEYYEQLVDEDEGKVPQPGWCSRQIAFMLDLSPEGELISAIPAEEKRGWARTVPEQVKRSSGTAANFLCDNPSYFLGIDAKGKPERSAKCFEAAKELHLSILGTVESPAAKALCSFFSTWDPVCALDQPAVAMAGDDLISAGNLIFRVAGKEVLSDPAIRSAWNSAYQAPKEDTPIMTCLISGEKLPIARLHPFIKGVFGAQSMGASLVGFNNPSLESYGHDGDQGLNAPVSEYAAFAYGAALNYLLADRNHHVRLGDTTIVYWASECDEACSGLATNLLSAGGKSAPKDSEEETDDPDVVIDAVMKRLSAGLFVKGINPDAEFFVLGVAPNTARLAVRFFLRNTFGETLQNIRKHYERISMVHAPHEREYLSPFQLLIETENPNSKQGAAISLLGGALMRSILQDLPYPEALYSNTLLRVRSTQDNSDRHTRKITRGRAAIVKAYMLKNHPNRIEGEATMSLNEERTDAPYVLGRLFSVLEDIQMSANPGIKTTIKSRYYDSACATPGMIFPSIIKLSDRHMEKLQRDKPNLATYYNKIKGGLLGCLDAFPRRLSLLEQGDFILGYYHQSQKKYEGKKQDIDQKQEA